MNKCQYVCRMIEFSKTPFKNSYIITALLVINTYIERSIHTLFVIPYVYVYNVKLSFQRFQDIHFYVGLFSIKERVKYEKRLTVQTICRKDYNSIKFLKSIFADTFIILIQNR